MNYNFDAWNGFEGGTWKKEINVRSFIRHNYTPYDGDESFLEDPTQDTLDLWDQVMDLTKQEIAAGGVLDMDTKIVSLHKASFNACNLIRPSLSTGR